MRKDRSLLSGLAFLASLAALSALGAGCGDDSSSGGGGGSGGEGGGAVPAACADVDISACSIALGPSDDDTSNLQEALIEAQSGDVVCLCPGTYSLNNEVATSTPDLTVRGAGENREDVILDFEGQIGGDDGMVSTADGFTIENLWVKNTPGNGIVVTGVEGVTFRNLKVSWDAGSVTENGAYAIYPVSSSKVLVEDCEIVGAADAGAYIGQSEQVIVRRNDVHGNVAGIEIENCTDSDVYENKSYDNAAGILVFSLPNLEKTDSFRANVHDNEIYENNRANFAEGGTIVASVPPGIGVLILAADETQVHDNDIHDNATSSIVMVSYDTLCVLLPGGCGDPDPDTDRDPENTNIYGNTFDNNGTAPSEPLSYIDVIPLEDMLWDGVEKEPGSGELCLSDDPPSFRNIHGVANISDQTMHTTDTTPHECQHPDLEPIDF